MVTHANASKGDICNDSVEAVCTTENHSERQLHLANQISLQAVNEAQAFLGDRTQVSLPEFLNSVADAIRAGRANAHEFQRGLIRGLAYLSCVDYLSRGYFSSNRDYSYLGLKCFPNGPTKSLSEIRSAFDRLGDVQLQQKTVALFNEIKSDTARVVSESNYDHVLKRVLLAQVVSTEYLSMKDYVIETLESAANELAKVKDGSSQLPSVLVSILNQCDLSAQSANAFNYAATVTGPLGSYTHHRMVICPSMWVYGTHYAYAKPRSDDSNDRLAIRRDQTAVKLPVFSVPEISGNPDNMVVVVAHELGHSVDMTVTDLIGEIDLKKGPTAEQVSALGIRTAFTSCLKGRYGDRGTLLATFKGAITLDPATSAKLFFNEYHADSIASNVMSIYLKKYPDLSSRRSIIAGNLTMFCGSTQHDLMQSQYVTSLHPSGEFRIENSFLGNQKLRETLGCKAAPKVYGCSFR
jgi:hypothetical protein